MTYREEQAVSHIGTDPKAFYNSRVWRNKAREILRRDLHECQDCKRRGRYRRAECVHHIEGIDTHPELALTDSNLTSLCKQCHNMSHDKYKNLAAKKSLPPLTPERW